MAPFIFALALATVLGTLNFMSAMSAETIGGAVLSGAAGGFAIGVGVAPFIRRLAMGEF